MEFYNGERPSCSQGKPNTTRSNLIVLLVALVMTGCAIPPQVVTVEENQQRVILDLILQQQEQDVMQGAILLAEAAARTLRNNLDFGVSYYRAQQATDIVLIQEEQKRKVINRTVQDVCTAYWRAVNYERLIVRMRHLKEKVCQSIEQNNKIEQQRWSNPKNILAYKLTSHALHA